MKKTKTYKEYQDEAQAHNEAILAKYGAPPEAQPPLDRSAISAPSDYQFRSMAFTKKRSLEDWKPTGRKYD